MLPGSDLPGTSAVGPQPCQQDEVLLVSAGHVMPTVVLATVQVPVYDVVGGKTILRALLDTGSSASFITERALKRMRVSRRPCPIRVNSVGVDQSQGVNGCVNLALGYVREGLLCYVGVDALIMTRVVGNLPPSPIAEIDLPN